jgi:hypothetical protein
VGDVLRQSDCGALHAARARVTAVLRDQVSRDRTDFGSGCITLPLDPSPAGHCRRGDLDTGYVALARIAANSFEEAASINLTESVTAVTEIRTKDRRLLPA